MPKYRRVSKVKREKMEDRYIRREIRTGKPVHELHGKKHATFEGFDEGRLKRERVGG
jgi:hypothetical protein